MADKLTRQMAAHLYGWADKPVDGDLATAPDGERWMFSQRIECWEKALKSPTIWYQTDAPPGAADGDMWFDTDDNQVWVWVGGEWKGVKDPTGKGGFYGGGSEPATGPTVKVDVSTLAEGETVRLGDHEARRQGRLDWVCVLCGAESADAGMMAEVDCG